MKKMALTDSQIFNIRLVTKDLRDMNFITQKQAIKIFKALIEYENKIQRGKNENN